MTSAEPVSPSQRQSLSLDFDLAHPPEKVWRALTDPVLLTEWLLPVVGFRLEPGTAFMFRTQPHPGWDGRVSCRLLDIEPYRRLRYSWTVPFLDTVVTFTLTPTTSGTRLNVLQSGFEPTQKREFGGARYGWTTMGGKLADLLARMP
jgi:uncharacterized protein YndB with AHSA1/START domain